MWYSERRCELCGGCVISGVCGATCGNHVYNGLRVLCGGFLMCGGCVLCWERHLVTGGGGVSGGFVMSGVSGATCANAVFSGLCVLCGGFVMSGGCVLKWGNPVDIEGLVVVHGGFGFLMSGVLGATCANPVFSGLRELCDGSLKRTGCMVRWGSPLVIGGVR